MPSVSKALVMLLNVANRNYCGAKLFLKGHEIAA
jgi:hypothetical protein